MGLVLWVAPVAGAAGADPLPADRFWAVTPALTLEVDDSATSTDWRDRFGYELFKNQTLLFDRLGPPAGYELTRLGQVRRSGIFSEMSSRAAGAFERVLQDSAQETALAFFPVDEWLEILPLDKWQGFAQRLFQGSFGNTAEQELMDLSPTYSASESSWRNAGNDRTLRYGIRPRTAPYFYLASQIGHFEGRPALAIDARARYLPFNRVQTTLAATIALPDAFELSLSAVSEPLRASHTTSTAARLQRVVGQGPSAAVVFIGFLHDASETAVVFGLSRPW
jgi:hypothetical protein